MNNLDAVISFYKNTDEKVLVADEKMSVIWKNSDSLPDFVSAQAFGNAFSLPLKESIILQYTDSFTVKIVPVIEDEKSVGYVFAFFDPEEIEMLCDRSVHYKYKRNMTGNERMALMPIINTLDEYHSQGKELPSEFFYEAKKQVTKLLSSTVNYSELSKYYSGKIFTELLNASQCLEQAAEIFRSRFSEQCEFSYDIQSGMFINTNSDCMTNAVLNLLVNAFMYNDKTDKSVQLKAYKSEDKLCIEVHDNGESADLEKMKKAMKPFMGLENFGQGESLGLALVSKFAEYFGGDLSFERQKGKGLTVRLTVDARIKEKPTSFKLRRQPLLVGDFEPASCILAKGKYEK